MSRRSNYRIIEDTEKVLCIEDMGPWNQCLSVTNDAENVVLDLAGTLNGRRLEYIDSMGQRDQLLVVDGHFAGFAPAVRKE